MKCHFVRKVYRAGIWVVIAIWAFFVYGMSWLFALEALGVTLSVYAVIYMFAFQRCPQ